MMLSSRERPGAGLIAKNIEELEHENSGAGSVATQPEAQSSKHEGTINSQSSKHEGTINSSPAAQPEAQSSHQQASPVSVATQPEAQSSKHPEGSVTMRDVATVKCGPPTRKPKGLDDEGAPFTWFDDAIHARGGSRVRVNITQWYKLGRPCCGLWMCIPRRQIPSPWHGMKIPFRKRPSDGKHLAACPKHIDYIREHVFSQCPACKYFVIGTSDGCGPVVASVLRAVETNKKPGIIVAGTQERDGLTRCIDKHDKNAAVGVDVTAEDLALADLVVVDSRRQTYSSCPKSLTDKTVNIGEYWLTPSDQRDVQDRIMDTFAKQVGALPNK